MNKDIDLSIKEEFISLSALNQFIAHDSSPRGTMFLTQLSQGVVLDKPEPKIIQSGLEQQLVDNTFKIVVEEDMVVKSIITNDTKNNVDNAPLITIIGENTQTGEIDCYDIPFYFSLHQYFGFRYIRQEILKNIYVGMLLEKGVILAETPGVIDNNYSYGVNANIALITDPAGGQDGVIIGTKLAKKLSYKIYVKGSLEWGADSFPLNLYGDIDNYKAFPEKGESIGKDQVFGVIREYDKDIGPALTSKKDTMEFNPIFDKAFYVNPSKELRNENDVVMNNRVVDLRVIHSPNSKKEPLYNNEQTHKLIKEHKAYLQSLVKAYESVVKDGFKDKNTTPRLQRKLVEAYTILPDDEKIVYKYRNDKVDLYRIEFVVEFDVHPGIGAKLSDSHGAKGIIVDVRDDMPVDKYGNVADIIMDPTSIPGRMNAGRLYESYFGGASRNARMKVLESITGYNIDDKDNDFGWYENYIDKVTEKARDMIVKDLDYDNANTINKAFDVLLEFLSIIDTEQYVSYSKVDNSDDKLEILREIVEKELYIYYKVSSKKKPPEVVRDMEKTKFYVPREPIMFEGKPTKEGITIGNLYVILLNKTADGYLASASPSVNHFGIPVRVNTSTKTGLPYTNNPTKIISETESRLYRSYAKSPILAAEFKDRASSMRTHSAIYHNTLKADKPSNMPTAVDRSIIPYGTDNSLSLIKDIFNSTGINFKYVNGEK